MRKFKNKLMKQIMAVLLSGAMIFTGMPVSAAELATEPATELSTEETGTEEVEKSQESGTEDGSQPSETAKEEKSGVEASDDKSSGDKAEQTEDASEKESTVVEIESGDEAEQTEDASEKESTAVEIESEGDREAETEENTVEEDDKDIEETGAYVFEAENLETFTADAKTDGDTEKAGTDNYFTLIYSTKSKIDSNSKTWTQGNYKPTKRVNFGGKLTIEKNAIKFTTKTAAKIGIWWAAGDVNRQMGILDGTGNKVAATTGADWQKNEPYYSELELTSAGTYYLGGVEGNNYIVKVVVKEEAGSSESPDRGSWSNVADPTIVDPIVYDVSKKDTEIAVTVRGVVNRGGEGADEVIVNMYDTNTITDETTPIDKKNSTSNTTEENEHKTTLKFTPEASGIYYFQAVLKRSVETDTDYKDRKSAVSSAVEFKLPLSKPEISSASFKEKAADGKGTISVAWKEVKEADKYKVSLSYTDDANKNKTIEAKETTKTSIDITGLEMNSVVNVTVQAFRGAGTADIDKSAESAAKEVSVSENKNPVYTVDVTGGLAAGTEYGGEDDILTITVMQDMPYNKTEKYAQGTSAAKYKKDDGTTTNCKNGEIPVEGAAFVITAVKSAEITFDLKATAKGYCLVNKSEKYPLVKGDAIPDQLTFPLHAGETYYFYATGGSKPMVKGISYTKAYAGEVLAEDYAVGGLKAGTTYGGEDSIVTFTVMQDMPYNETEKYIQGTSAAKYKKADGTTTNCKNGEIPVEGAAFVITAAKSAEITFELKATAKGYCLVNESDKHPLVNGDAIPEKLTFPLYAGETYYFYATGGSKPMVYGIYWAEWYSGEEVPVDRGNWDTDVAVPEITKIETTADGKITVTAKGVVARSGKGGDSIKVEMYDAKLVDILKDDARPIAVSEAVKSDTKADNDHSTSFTFTPDSSGEYMFKAILSRNEEKNEDGSVTTFKDKISGFSARHSYKVPLAAPSISKLMNLDAVDGTGGITAAWGAVPEADYYILAAKNAEGNEINHTQTEGTTAEITGLTINDTVKVTVTAYRENTTGEPDSKESAAKEITITGEKPAVYMFDAKDYAEEASSDGVAQSAGRKFGTSDYYTLAIAEGTPANGTLLRTASSGALVFLQVYQNGGSGLTFTVYGEADATFEVASTGGTNWSVFGLVNSENKLVKGSVSGTQVDNYDGSADEGAYAVYNTTLSTLEYKGLKAGTYTLLSPALNSAKHGENSRGGRIHSAAVYDNGKMPDRGEWDDSEDKIGRPVISKIAYTKGESKITVTASGYIGYYGADSLRVDMLDSKGEIVDSIIQAADSKVKEIPVTDADGNPVLDADGNQQKITVSDGDVALAYVFTPKASDDYSFRANLVRSGQDDIPMADKDEEWTVNDFVLPLATPSVSSMTNVKDKTDKGKGSLEVMFKGVDEADYYVVAAFSDKEPLAVEYVDIEKYTPADPEKNPMLASAKDDKKEYMVTLGGLPKGSCYVTVQAFRNAESKLGEKVLNQKAETTTITRIVTKNEDGTESVTIDKSIRDTLELKMAELKELDENKALTDEELKAKALELLGKAAAPTDDGKAVGAARSKAYNPDASKYVNGKNDTRWSHSVFGSNTTRNAYSRAKGLNAFDGEYDGSKSASVPANGYYEEVYGENDAPDADKIGDLKSVTVWSENGRGKVVPNSTDGMSFYYTSINPSENNFTLSALIHAKSWQYSNGQDGFGMMVSDTVGADGDDGAAWMNAYQLLASKIQYSWRIADDKSGEAGYVTNAAGNGTTVMRYDMKLGVGWNSKEGATAADVAKIKAGLQTAPENFSTSSGTLETSAGRYNNGKGQPTGSYNIVGNCYNADKAPASADKNLLTDFRFQIQKYDNAYVLRYLEVGATPNEQVEALDDEAKKDYVNIGGSYYKKLGEQVFSDDNNNKLTQIDKNNVYVGFFAARNARIGVNEIQLVPTPTGEVYEIPVTKIDPSVTVSSMNTSNSESYDLILNANFDGTLTIYKEEDGKKGTMTAVTTGKEITAGTKYTFTSKLDEGTTEFTYYAKPNENYVPGDNKELSNTDMQKGDFTVTYHAFAGDNIYVAQNGKKVGEATIAEDGTKSNFAGSAAEYPTNIYDAVDYAKPGQTIILAGGMYDLTRDAYSGLDSNGKPSAKNLLIGKYHDGTSKKLITMKAADPDNRPVLDFGQNTQKNDTAFTVAGNYWRLEGFDVIGSSDGQKGILLAGSHNVLKDIRTYLNGNTGLQVARYGSDGRAQWPSYNTILNCSSFMNYDAGYEDADGYAAKLTCGDGNRFVGCISAFNADDGWDLFAKVETGSIGVVTIENCLAFKNGYLFGEEDYYKAGSDLIYRYTDLSKYTRRTHLVSAGNGNGFKMGGDSMSGYHVLKNSIAFGNKSKGIDSNSCPDIQIYNSISFNNEQPNVALYTGGAVNTDYNVEGLISFKDSSCSGYTTPEDIKPKGTQNRNKIYRAGNFYWDGSKSVDADGLVFDTKVFVHASMNTAIFGGAKGITRDANGSINLNGFLVGKEGSNLGNIGIGSSSEEDVLDVNAEIYVFAEEYCKGGKTLGAISLNGAGANEEAIKLSEKKYKWSDSTIMLAAYAGSSVDFKVTDENETNEKTVTVNFIQLDGAQLVVTDGDENKNGVLEPGETWTVEAVPVISPAVEPDVELSGFSAEIKETTKQLLTFEGTPALGLVNEKLKTADAQVKVKSGSTNGMAKMTAAVSLTAGNKTVKQTAVLEFEASNGERIKFDGIEPDPAQNQDKISWNQAGDDSNIWIAMNKVSEFTMKNLHFVEWDAATEQEKIKDFGKGVKISVNDTSVIKLKSTSSAANGIDATFTVVNKSGDGGTATVTVTSKSDKSLVRNYVVTVCGSDFAWSAGTVTIDKAKTAGIQLRAVAPFGQKLENIALDGKDEEGRTTYGIKVSKVYKGTKVTNNPASGLDSYFTASQVIPGRVYEINTTKEAVTGLPKGTYTIVFKTTIATDNGDGTSTPKDYEFTPITVKVNETKPAVTFKQTKKVNLFYKNATAGSTGKLSAVSKQGAVKVTAGANNNFRFTDNGAGYDIICTNNEAVSIGANGAANISGIKSSNKVTLTAHVDGYHEDYDVTKQNFAVAVEYRQPKLKLTALDKTIYTKIGMDSADIWIYNPDDGTYLTPDTAAIELSTSTEAADKKAYSKANEDFTVNGASSLRGSKGETGVRLTIKSAEVKGGTVKMRIRHDDWFRGDAVIVSQNIGVNNKTMPKLTIKPVKLNVNENFVGKEQVTAAVVINGATGFGFKFTGMEGTNAKAEAFLKFVSCEPAVDKDGNNILLVSLKAGDEDGNAFSSTAGSYSFKAKYRLGSAQEEQETNFKVSLVKNEKLTVSVKGSIDVVNRANSTVTLQPKMTNFTPLQVADVTLGGEAASLFTVTSFDRETGAVTVKAKEMADLKKGSYKVMPEYTFDLGLAGTVRMKPDKPVTISTKQSSLKVSGLKEALEVKLSSKATAAERIIAVTPSGAHITDMTQIGLTDSFTLTYTGDGIQVSIRNRAGLKEGKTYKITALITVEGGASNVKKQLVTVPVKVLR